MYQTSIEVSLFENTYFVNKLYIVKYVFLHRQFFRTRWIFGTILKIIIYLVKEKKEKKRKKSENMTIWSGSLPSLYNAIRLYVKAEASHESCTEIL